MPSTLLVLRRLAACALVVAVAGCARSGAARQRTYARLLRPDPVRVLPAAATPVQLRTYRVRAYADDDYQAASAEWDRRIADQVRRAADVLEGAFGVRLEVESVRPWRRSDRSMDLEHTLDEVARLDPARDVDWVIGFVAPATYTSWEPESVGMARLFGRHMVLRAMESPDALARLEVAFDQLSDEERRAFARDGRVHRETAVLLHEWAHTLGAVHECADRWIMSRRYSLLETTFSPESVRLVRLGLEHRDECTPEARRAWLSAFRGEAARMTGLAWECPAMEDGLAKADGVLARLADGNVAATDDHPVALRYGRAVRDAVLARWKASAVGALPALATCGSARRAATLHVGIGRSGALDDVRMSRSSGLEELDASLVAAARSAQPFPPPPAELLLGASGVQLQFPLDFER